MKITFALPGWPIFLRLCEWWSPGLEDRADTFGKASANRRWLHGTIDITATVEKVEK